MNRRPRGESLDRIVAAAVLVLGQIELWVGHAVSGPRWLAMAIVVVSPATIAIRRRHPLVAGAIVLYAQAALFASGGNDTSVALALSWFCALYAIAVWTDTTGFLAGLGMLVSANALASLGDADLKSTVQFTVVPTVVMVIVRRAVRERQLRAEALAARAELLEREHALHAQQAVADERARIARELHDLVAHNVSVMVVQAGAERHALGDDRAATRETLASIEAAGRQALTDARRVVGMLRTADDEHALEPQPGLGDLDALLEQIRRAGLPVTLEVDGEPAPLPSGLDLCAYRIVQEALTNALKHAGPARAHVRLHWSAHALDLDVVDDGRGPLAANGSGHGLIGMRERVALYGGRLETGPGEDHGFAVRAHLPRS